MKDVKIIKVNLSDPGSIMNAEREKQNLKSKGYVFRSEYVTPFEAVIVYVLI